MNDTNKNIELVQNAYAAFGKGDVPAILAMMTEDVTMGIVGRPEDAPFLGLHSGKMGVGEFFRQLGEAHEIHMFEAKRFVAGEDKVSVWGHYRWTMRASGVSKHSEWLHEATVRGGRIASWLGHNDTAMLAARLSQDAGGDDTKRTPEARARRSGPLIPDQRPAGASRPDLDASVRRAEIVMALSQATDLAIGQPVEYALKSCVLGVRLGAALGLDRQAIRETYYHALLRYIGCNAETDAMAALFGDEIAFRRTAATLDMGNPAELVPALLRAIVRAQSGQPLPTMIWRVISGITRSRSFTVSGFQAHCEAAQRLARRLGFDDAIVEQPRPVPGAVGREGLAGRTRGCSDRARGARRCARARRHRARRDAGPRCRHRGREETPRQALRAARGGCVREE